jgi:hypothetical protein
VQIVTVVCQSRKEVGHGIAFLNSYALQTVALKNPLQEITSLDCGSLWTCELGNRGDSNLPSTNMTPIAKDTQQPILQFKNNSISITKWYDKNG